MRECSLKKCSMNMYINSSMYQGRYCCNGSAHLDVRPYCEAFQKKHPEDYARDKILNKGEIYTGEELISLLGEDTTLKLIYGKGLDFYKKEPIALYIAK